jgi:hypothetical protein
MGSFSIIIFCPGGLLLFYKKQAELVDLKKETDIFVVVIWIAIYLLARIR